MKIIFYNELNPNKITNCKKICGYLQQNDFHAAQVKKIADNLYRAKLDRVNRLLFSIYKYEDVKYILILEHIKNHNYDSSRFLKGTAVIDEDKVIITADAITDIPSLVYLNTKHPKFNLLDKIISFDAEQQSIFDFNPPMIIVGSAGSGKTALTLEKMKQMVGDVLYTTRSPYLVHNSRQLYYAHGYENDSQNITFLSFDDYLSSIDIPQGSELTFQKFSPWINHQKLPKFLKDPYQLFEEFKGVITGDIDVAYISREDYLSLGVKRSIFQIDERNQVYDIFEKYLKFMQKNNYFDANILSYQYLQQVKPCYDFIVIDEVQDLTNIQLQVLLASLNDPNQFLLCGDSNQIVHPNFFSWANIKSMFYKQSGYQEPAQLIRILNDNYRNSPEITELANGVLKIKTNRFGSVDKESNYLVNSSIKTTGAAILLKETPEILQELNQKTKHSIEFAIIVMHPEQKQQAKSYFDTPLIFSIQEAKGLEYKNIILYNFTSADEERFREITKGVQITDMSAQTLHYARVKDKTDKSLEIYKFHINALYVAMTRAICNIYLIERNTNQAIFKLLALQESNKGLDLTAYKSNMETWRKEARNLELQGKTEQAEEIRSRILQIKKVSWEVLAGDKVTDLDKRTFVENNKKAKLLLFEYALVYQHYHYMNKLAKIGFKPALRPENGLKLLTQKYYTVYNVKHTTGIMREVAKFGVDYRNIFNQTPLMIAARLGNINAVMELTDAGADVDLINNAGLNAFQICLEQASIDSVYSKQKLSAMYQKLEPDNITIQANHKLYQLDNKLMEFIMLNTMIAMFYSKLGKKNIADMAFSSQDFIDIFENFPLTLLPERRKKRTYISSILSKNEVNSSNPYNRKLFIRFKRGQYIFNPKLSLRIAGEWEKIYDLLQIDMIGCKYEQGFDLESNDLWNKYVDKQIKDFKDYITTLTTS